MMRRLTTAGQKQSTICLYFVAGCRFAETFLLPDSKKNRRAQSRQSAFLKRSDISKRDTG